MMDINTEILPNNPHLRQAIFKAFRGKCFYTGQSLTLETMEIDHIFPKSKGGKNCISNYVLCSKQANLVKKARVNRSIVQGVIYYNSITYAPKVLRIYNKLCSQKPPKQPKTLASVKVVNLKNPLQVKNHIEYKRDIPIDVNTTKQQFELNNKITITQAAEKRGVDKSTIWRWIKVYNIEAIRIGFAWFVNEDTVMKFQPPQRGPRKKVNDES